MKHPFVTCGLAALILCCAGVASAEPATAAGAQDGSTHATQAAPTSPRLKIEVDASLHRDPTAMAVWVAYGVWLGLHHPGLDRERAAGLHVYVPTFDVDYSARANQITVWNEIKAKDPSITNKYMMQLEAIDTAGFMREYVWEFYHRTGWTAPPGLAIARFDAWRKQHLPDLAATTHAHLAM